MPQPDTHFDRFWTAIDGANEGLSPAHPEHAGQVYAQIATAHAIMHLTDVLIDVRGHLESINATLKRRGS